MSLRWTKLQDFCLRLGMLKVLVASLPMSRTSSSRRKVLRRLEELLFAPVRSGALLESARDALRLEEEEDAVESVADALLMSSGAASWGQPIKRKTAYKLLEWGHTTGLVVKGNRISERGLMLRSLFDEEAVEAFLGGDVLAWNPFVLSGSERVFFLYHLGEIDEVLWRIAVALGTLGSGHEVTVSDTSVYEITLEAMKQMLEGAQDRVSIPELPDLRTVRDLVNVIDHELHPESASRSRAAYGPPAPRKPGPSRRSARTKKSSKKNADHQAIPRFEQLVDMGFLTKSVGPDLRGPKLERARKAWSFVTTEAAAAFSGFVSDVDRVGDGRWKWSGFGAATGASGIAGSPTSSHLSLDVAMEFFVECYERIRRRAGHTPFESVAILVVIQALEEGHWVEIAELHGIFLELKRSGALEHHVYFAAGNEIDRMFIELAPSFQTAWGESGLGQRLGWGLGN